MEDINKIITTYSKQIYVDTETMIEKADKLVFFVQTFLQYIDGTLKVNANRYFNYEYTDHTIDIGIQTFLPMEKDVIEIHKYILEHSQYDYRPYCSYHTFCLFHEVGHSQMLSLYNDNIFAKEIVKFTNTQFKLNNKYEKNKLDDFELQIEHMKLPLEAEANSWAMLFIKQNKEIIKQFDKIFLELVSAIIK